MAGRRPVSVRPHTRNGKPVKGYTQNRWSAAHIAEMLRTPGNGRRATFTAAVFGGAVALWYAFSLTLTVVEAGAATASVLVGVGALLLGVQLRQHRRGSRGRSVTFSPRRRWRRVTSRVRRNMPMARYRRTRDGLRRRHPVAAALYDRHRAVYEVTRTRRVKGKTETVTKRVRGLNNADWHRKNPGDGWKARDPRIVLR